MEADHVVFSEKQEKVNFLEALKNTTDTEKNKIKDLEGQIANLEARLKTSQLSEANCRAKYDDLFKKHDKLKKTRNVSLIEKAKEIEALKGEGEQQQRLLRALWKSYDTLEKELKEIKHTKEEAEKCLINERKTFQSKLQNTSSDFVEQQKENRAFREHMNKTPSDEKERLNSVIKKLRSEKASLESTVQKLQDNIALGEKNLKIRDRTLDQKHLDLARLQGQVVDLKSLRSNYEALLRKKTQVECERDELQKRYSEVVKKVGEMEQATEKVTSEKAKREENIDKHEETLSDLEKKLTLIHQEEVEQAMLEKDQEIEKLKKIIQAQSCDKMAGQPKTPVHSKLELQETERHQHKKASNQIKSGVARCKRNKLYFKRLSKMSKQNVKTIRRRVKVKAERKNRVMRRSGVANYPKTTKTEISKDFEAVIGFRRRPNTHSESSDYSLSEADLRESTDSANDQSQCIGNNNFDSLEDLPGLVKESGLSDLGTSRPAISTQKIRFTDSSDSEDKKSEAAASFKHQTMAVDDDNTVETSMF